MGKYDQTPMSSYELPFLGGVPYIPLSFLFGFSDCRAQLIKESEGQSDPRTFRKDTTEQGAGAS